MKKEKRKSNIPYDLRLGLRFFAAACCLAVVVYFLG